MTSKGGIGWDRIAMECSPLAQGESMFRNKNEIRGFLSHFRFPESQLSGSCAHKVAQKKKKTVRGKQPRVAIRPENTPRIWYEGMGEKLRPLVASLFWNGSPTLSKPLAHSFPLCPALRGGRHQHRLKEKPPRTFKSLSSTLQPTLPLLFYSLSL